MHIDEYKGYKKINFTIDGRESFIVCPKKPAEGRPWIWRAEFFGAFDAIDMTLLERGYFRAYTHCSDMYGCPESVEYFKKFRDTVVSAFDLKEKAVLAGISRGGLYACNYALKYPDEVSLLYLDAPVLDMRSWPGGAPSGLGKGEGSPECWEQCKACYRLTDKEAEIFAPSPINHIEELAKTDIPVLIIAGDADTVVPVDENSDIFAEKFRALGGQLEMIVKPGCGHHPHGLEDNPCPAADYIEKYAL